MTNRFVDLIRLFLLIPITMGLACAPQDPNPCSEEGIGQVDVIASGFADGTEGIAFSPDGRLFVSHGDTVAEVATDGSWQPVADVLGTIGVTWWGERLMVASGDDGQGTGFDAVYAVDVDTGQVELFGGAGISGANFITVTPWDTILVSDPSDGTILEMNQNGAATLWSDAIESPNGMVFNEVSDALYVATTFDAPTHLWRIPIADQQAGTPESIVEYEPSIIPDGIARGQSGAIYIAQNIAGRIDVVTEPESPDTALSSTIGEGTAWAASLAFGPPDSSWDQCSVYVTSLFGEDLFRVNVGEPGAALHH